MPGLEPGDRDAGAASTAISSSPRALRAGSPGSPRASGSVVFTAFTIAPCIPSATSCVNSTADLLEAGRLEPGLVLALRERARDAADEAPTLRALAPALSSSSATTSLIPIRPPGLSTRAISVSTAALSTERLITQFEMTTSTESAGSGISSITPFEQMHVR